MKVTIIIPTYNRKDKLASLLEDIVRIDHKDVVEVIVCDDGSDEDVFSVINCIKFDKPIHHFTQTKIGFRAGQARNLGIKAAKGDLLVFLDDDVRISANFIDAHIDRHKQMSKRSIVFGFRYRTFDKIDNILDVPLPSEDWLTDSRIHEVGVNAEELHRSDHPWFYVYSCNFSVRSDLEFPLFDPTFSGWGMEDIEYAYRLHHYGYEIAFEPKAWLLHIESERPRDPFRCEEIDKENKIEKQYTSYVQNCMRFLQKYPQDNILRELIKQDLSWYVKDDLGRWIKNGFYNDFGDVLKAHSDGVPVNSEILHDSIFQSRSMALDEKPLKIADSSLLYRKLDEIAIELTVYCNLKCEMCSVWEIKKHGISNDRAKLMLKEAYELGARTFIPCGAESFMRKDFLDIVQFASDLGYSRQEIVTNGLMLTDQVIARLQRIDSVYLHISIDGPRHIHDRLRGEGAYAKLMTILEKLKAAGVKFGISSVIMRETLPFLRHIIDLASELELEEISMQPFQFEISGMEKDTKRFSFLRNQEPFLIHELSELYKYAKKRKIKLFTESLFHTIPDYLIHHKRPIPLKGCHMPSRFLLIDHAGEIYPCFFMREETMGNANCDSLTSIWHSAIHKKMQEIALSKVCPGCLAACSDIASFNETNQTVNNV